MAAAALAGLSPLAAARPGGGPPGQVALLGQPLRSYRPPPVPAGALPDPVLGLVLRAGDPLAASRLRGARLALDLAARAGGPRLALRTARAQGPWASAAGVVRDLLYEHKALALIGPPDGPTSHLLEQLAVKAHRPVLSLSEESSLTRVPVPWLVRVVPDVRSQVSALLAALPAVSGALVACVPDGREGREVRGDLRAAARARGFEPGTMLTAGQALGEAGLAACDRAQPLLLWLDEAPARRALARLAELGWSGPIWLRGGCTVANVSAARSNPGAVPRQLDCRVLGPPRADGVSWRAFRQAYLRAYGEEPDQAAASAFDAAALLVRAVSRAGPDPSALLRWLAHAAPVRGATGTLAFDGTGNRVSGCAPLVREVKP